MAQPNADNRTVDAHETEEHNFKYMGAYSKESKFSITTDQLRGLSYRSKIVAAGNDPPIKFSQTVKGRQFHDYCLLGYLSTKSQFEIRNQSQRANRHQVQDEGTRSTTVTPSYGLQLHAYGLLGLLSNNSSFKIENQITFNGEEQPPQGNRDERRASPTSSRRSPTRNGSVRHCSTINGLVVHSYGMVGANSSGATIKINNAIYFMESNRNNNLHPGNASFNFNRTGIREFFSRVFNDGKLYFSYESDRTSIKNRLNLNISTLQPSSGSDNTNTSRNNTLSVEANATDKSVVCDQKVNGTILHSYDLMGVCCEKKSKFTINNPISGLKRERMVPSSGSDSGPANINDFVIINNRR